MPIISLAASKGGSGKSTLCMLIGSELAVMGLQTQILCADPQHSSWKWAERCKQLGRLPENLSVQLVDHETQLQSHLNKADQQDIVLIDPQGALTSMLALSIVAADLSVAPCKASYMDAVEAQAVFGFAQNLRRANMRLVLNDVKGIDQRTGAYRDAIGAIVRHKIPYFETVVQSRPVYAQFSKDAGSLDNLNDGPAKAEQIAKARANIGLLIKEIFALTGVTSDE